MDAHPLDTLTPITGGQIPLLDRYLDQMLQAGSPHLQPLLRAFEDEDRVTYRQLSDWLIANGYPVGDSAVYSYRRKYRWRAWCARNGVVIEPRP